MIVDIDRWVDVDLWVDVDGAIYRGRGPFASRPSRLVPRKLKHRLSVIHRTINLRRSFS